jgi:hypothetical protein
MIHVCKKNFRIYVLHIGCVQTYLGQNRPHYGRIQYYYHFGAKAAFHRHPCLMTAIAEKSVAASIRRSYEAMCNIDKYQPSVMSTDVGANITKQSNQENVYFTTEKERTNKYTFL